MKNIKEPPDKYYKYNEYKKNFTTIKTSLKSIVKNNDTIDKINNAVFNVNKIIVHTYQFFKLYCLDYFNKYGILPVIDNNLINSIMKILCKEDNRGRKPNEDTKNLKLRLQKFYDSNYSKLLDHDLNLYYTNLNTILDYETIDMMTNIENHIKNNFYRFFCRFINARFDKEIKEKEINKENISKEERKQKIRNFRYKLSAVKKEIINNTNNLSSKYDVIKHNIRTKYFHFADTNQSIISQVDKNPILFLISLIKMSLYIEETKKSKTFCCFPLRTSIIPKYIRLDTTTIIHLLFSSSQNKTFYLNNGNTILFREHIWGLFFRTERKMFRRKKYLFNNQIVTDGIGCSILLINKNKYKEFGRNKIPTMKKPFGYREDRYINELDEDEIELYKQYSVVGIDPGKCDLIFGTNGSTKIIEKNGRDKHIPTTFRYSQNQRRKETKMKKYKKIIEKHKITSTIDGKTIKEIESNLSQVNSKSNDYFSVQLYIMLKSKINRILEKYYQNIIYRKLKWNSFINKQKSESKMLNMFKNKFGSPDNVLVAIGDYSQKQQLKYSEPTKGISMRKLFRKFGYKTFLVNEYNTSKMNHFTGEEMEKFRRRCNVRPWKNNIKKMHGLLRSKNIHNNKLCNNVQGKHILLNRDLNGSLNIRQKAICVLMKIALPNYLKRTK